MAIGSEVNTVDTSTPMMLFTGNAHRTLSEDVAHRLGVPLGKAQVGTFSDGEVQIEIEENVRRQEVFVLQPTGAPSAVNLFELLALTDALKRASAASVTAISLPFGAAIGLLPPIYANGVNDDGPGIQWRLDHGVPVHIEHATLYIKTPSL